jgi:predicted nucleotidyltransferase
MELAKYKFLKALEELSFIKEIYLFGSRARGDNFDNRSDIDLAIVAPSATHKDWLKVQRIIDEADTLLKIDCIKFDNIKDEKFKENIIREKIVIFSRD